MSRSDGVLIQEEIRGCPGWPGNDIIEKKKVAVLECVEDIPCNPCETVCPVGAIRVDSPITNLPIIDGDKCTGCNLCIPICPGLAIFVLEKNYSADQSAISIPYELIPIPKRGDIVMALNRKGEKVCDATVIKVLKSKKFDRTNVITVAVDKEYCNEVRQIRVGIGRADI
jgi:Fe-S-cluster-containing hydrogenase component 2